MKKTILAMFVLLTASASAEVWINEFVSDPISGLAADEWVELASDQEESLEGCYLLENGGSKTTLNGTINGFMVIDDPKGTLNNDNEIITLVCPGFEDRVAYTKGPAKGKSMGLDEYGEWREYDEPTKGKPNYQAVPEFSTWTAILAAALCLGVFVFHRK